MKGTGLSYGPFNKAEAESIARWHVNVVRVPLNEDCWLGINGVSRAYSGQAYRVAVEKWVSYINEAGMIAIIDLHFSAPGSIVPKTEWPMPDETHSVTFWAQVASVFKTDPMVIFDLFNEPHLGRYSPTSDDWSCWLKGCTSTTPDCPRRSTCSKSVTYRVAGMQQLVDTVRDAGADQPLMIGGLDWASTPCGSSDSNGRVGRCSWLSYEPKDPLHQLIVSFHSYDHGYGHCDSLTCWNSTIAMLAKRVPVVTGELGESQTSCSATFVKQYMEWADVHRVSYLLWSWRPATKGCGSLRLLSNWDGSPNEENPVASLLMDQLRHAEHLKAVTPRLNTR